jgi:hypothetical protein
MQIAAMLRGPSATALWAQDGAISTPTCLRAFLTTASPQLRGPATRTSSARNPSISFVTLQAKWQAKWDNAAPSGPRETLIQHGHFSESPYYLQRLRNPVYYRYPTVALRVVRYPSYQQAADHDRLCRQDVIDEESQIGGHPSGLNRAQVKSNNLSAGKPSCHW